MEILELIWQDLLKEKNISVIADRYDISPQLVYELRDSAIGFMYNLNATGREIAQYWNLSKERVYQILRNKGVKIRGRGRKGSIKFSSEDYKWMVDRYLEGKSSIEISREGYNKGIEVSPSYVLEILKKRGVKIRKGGKRKLSDEDYDRIVEEYLRGENTCKIAEKFGVSQQYVSRILKKKGVERSSKGRTRKWKFLIRDFAES